MRDVSGSMIICMVILAILVAFASANPALVSAPSDQALWSTSEDGEVIYSAPLVIDCLPDNPKCGVREGEYIISLRPSYQKSAHSFYLLSHIPSSIVRNTSIRWSDDTDYFVKNLQHAEMEIIRRDPGIEEVYQNHWIEVNIGWDLRCRDPSLREEEKALCYGELEVEECKRVCSSEKDKRECLKAVCDMEGLMLTVEQRELCEKQSYKDEEWYQAIEWGSDI